jgi:hypothetical protein
MTCLVHAPGKGFTVHDQLHKVSVDAVVISKYQIKVLFLRLYFADYHYQDVE